MPQDYAGNSLTNAREVMLQNGLQVRSFSDRVDASDLNDYYKFRVQGRSSFGLKLTNSLGGDAQVELLNSDGRSLKSSFNNAETSELINTTLEAGTYYVRVYQGSGLASDYNLELTTQTNLQSDIFWRNAVSGTNVVWQMNGTTIASGAEMTPVNDLNWKMVSSSDFNSDGKADILWRNSVSGMNIIWFMNGSSILSGLEITAVRDVNWQIVGSDDFNSDGKADILWRNSASGENIIWFMNGSSIASGLSITPVNDLNWKIVGTGDFNSDGQADILWRNGVSGSNVIWFMNGSSIAAGSEIIPVRDMNWSIVDAGDFNNDGKADVLWRNAVSGTNVIWLMNGSSIASGVEITPVNDLNWKIMGVSNRFDTPAILDLVGNSLSSAFNLGNLSGNSSLQEWVGLGDSSDYYRFSLTKTSLVQLSLPTANAIFDVLDSAGNVIATQRSTLLSPISVTLNVGNYYIRVDKSSITTVLNGYTLSISSNEQIKKYDFTYFYNGSMGGESYDGYFYDYADKYVANQYVDPNSNLNENGFNGRYLIRGSSLGGTIADVGKVYVSSYYDHEVNTRFTPNGFLLNRASGTNFLGSEIDYINGSSGMHQDFGLDAWEYDSKPDLVATSFNISQTSVEVGSSITASFQVTNLGATSAAASSVAFYLSTDSMITSSDRFLGIYSIPLFTGSGASPVYSTNLTLPGSGDSFWATSGNYYIGMVVDSGNTVAEYNESNNSNRGLGVDLDNLTISIPSSIVTIAASDATAAERKSTEVADPGRFTLTRSGNLNTALTVNYQITGSATNGTDYGTLASSLTFAAGSSTAQINVNVIDDNLSESSETLTLTLTSGPNYTLGSAVSGTVSIADNDVATITVNSPNNGEILRPGGSYNITWTDNLSENVAIHLFKGNVHQFVIVGSTESDGSYVWTLPTNLVYGTDYKIAVATWDASISDFSDYNFSIKPDIKKYSFEYQFNPQSPMSGDSYFGDVIAVDGKYVVSSSTSLDIDSRLTESGQNGRYIIRSVVDYSDDLSNDLGKVFVSNYIDRDNGTGRVFTPVKYAAGQMAGSNYLGSEFDYIDSSQVTDSLFGLEYYEADPVLADPGNTIATAEMQSSAIFTRNERVSSNDLYDFYRFTVTQSGIFTANLTGLNGDADVRLIHDLNSNGTIDQGEILAWQWERGTGSESIRKFLNNTGTYYLQVMSYNNQTANYSIATGFQNTASDDRKFSININFVAGSEILSDEMRNATREAARFWENVISYSSFSSSHILSIDVGGANQTWNSSGRTLASAGYVAGAYDSNNNWMPTLGSSNINNNPEAVASLTASIGRFRRVMIHEIGHVLGLGTLWDTNGRSLINRSTGTYNANTYAGVAYGDLRGTFTASAIPLTTGVKEGSDYSHWKEEIFDTEIMTHESELGEIMPIHQITIASLRDIGWNVNYGAAEPYSLT